MERISQGLSMRLNERVLMAHAQNPASPITVKNVKEVLEWLKLQRICSNKKGVSPNAPEEVSSLHGSQWYMLK